jgi:hypothetical protein
MIYSRWGIKEVRLDIAFGKAVWRDQIDPIIAADERRRCCGLGRALARLDLDRERSCLRSHDVRKSETVPAIREMEADLRSRSSHLRASRIFHEHLQTRWNEASYRRLSKSLLGNLPAVGRCAHFKMHSQNSRPDREQRRATAAPAASMSAALSQPNPPP